jgi:methyl-accepting chemotaxis protein
MEEGNRVAANGTQLMAQASSAFSGIANVLHQTSELAQSISDASSEQVKGTEHVASAVQELASSLRENAGKARQSANIVEQMVRCSDQLTQALPPARHAAGPVIVKGDRSEADAPVFGRF